MDTKLPICVLSDGTRQVPVFIQVNERFLAIRPQGYGECTAEDGSGEPILLEVHNGELRLVVFADINKEDPTHVVSLENAQENKRDDLNSCSICGGTLVLGNCYSCDRPVT